jgi:CRISPR-associated protein Csd2
MAATNEAEKKKSEEASGEDERSENRTMGRNGLYRAHGFVSAKLAERTGFAVASRQVIRPSPVPAPGEAA